MRISKAVMITDQSQPPEAGARQVVYAHTGTHTHTHTHTHTLMHVDTHTWLILQQVTVHLHTRPGCETRKSHSPFTLLIPGGESRIYGTNAIRKITLFINLHPDYNIKP